MDMFQDLWLVEEGQLGWENVRNNHCRYSSSPRTKYSKLLEYIYLLSPHTSKICTVHSLSVNSNNYLQEDFS